MRPPSELALCVQALRVLTPCVRVRRAGTGISTRATPQRAPRARALRAAHTRRDAVAIQSSTLPCVCKLCARLRSAFGCAVLVQELAHRFIATYLDIVDPSFRHTRHLHPCAHNALAPHLHASMRTHRVALSPACILG